MAMEFVTLQEGSRLTGKAEMTIRRLSKKPGADFFTRKEADHRLYIGLTFLCKIYPPLPGLVPETKTFQAPPEPKKEKKVIGPPTHQPIQQSHSSVIVELLQEQAQELRKDKEFLQGRIEELGRQLSREQERTNFLLLQANNESTTDQRPANNNSTTTNQRPALLPSLILAVFLLFGVVAWLLINDSTTIQQRFNEPATIQQQPITGDTLP